MRPRGGTHTLTSFTTTLSLDWFIYNLGEREGLAFPFYQFCFVIQGFASLHYAAKGGHAEITAVLLASNADVNITSSARRVRRQKASNLYYF